MDGIEDPINPDPILSQEQIEDFSDIQIPADSEWNRCCAICGTFEHSKRKFCCYWEISPIMPIFVTVIMAFTYIIFLVQVVPYLANNTLKIVSVIQVSIGVIFFYWSYFSAVCSDPGYLPFNWVKTKKTKYSWDELMAGTALTSEQLDYVNSVKRPPGCSFSKSTGRYVIRADHICGWIANWVGKRNHKQFILMCIWGFYSATSLFVWSFFKKTKSSGFLYILELFTIIIEGIFAFSLLCTAPSFIVEITTPQTRIQKYKGEEAQEKSKIDAMREVCGNQLMICWLIPFHAFPDELELLDDLNQENNRMVM